MVTLISILAVVLGVVLAVVAFVYILVPFFTAVGWTIRHLGRFITGEIGDGLRIVGSAVTATVLGVLVILNVAIGRWSAAAHFGRAVQTEGAAMGAALYRVLVGHPARLLLLNSLTEGLERRLPAAMAAAPGADQPPASRGRSGQFEGYTIVGSLPGGGSGGKLYIAEPDAIKQAGLARAGHGDIRQVVIKTFSLRDGSSLPQIVRESRSLDAAKRLGLVLDHELTDERFYYVMRYVPGESLGLVTQRLHAISDQSQGEGLDERNLRVVLSYAADLLRTLDTYHCGGLWHKDVKPDNIIVGPPPHHSATLVDFGLVTPLRSAMTLTTHGTEYFRDPEMVRLALKGVKVHQVDGARFDIYAAGAVLFSMVENSFPAHGGLSQISKRCPEALRWIVRRAMTEYDKRYTSAAAMLADLEVVRQAVDPFAVKPFELPSMGGTAEPELDDRPIRPAAAPVRVGAGSDELREAPANVAFAGGPVPPRDERRSPPRTRPRIRVKDWWTGGYVVDGSDVIAPRAGEASRPQTPWMPRSRGIPAQEQLRSARQRAALARERARQRIASRRGGHPDFTSMNRGVSASVMVFMAIFLLFAAFMVMMGRGKAPVVRLVTGGSPAPTLYAHGQLGEEMLPVLAHQTSSASVRVARSDRPSPRVVVDGVPLSAAGSDVTTGGRRVLVINDAPTPAAPIGAAINRLASSGFVLLGNYPGNAADEEAINAQIDLTAQAHRVREVGRLDSPDVSLKLSQWVAAREEVDLLLWFEREGGEPDSPLVYWLFRPAAVNGHALNDASKTSFQAASQALSGGFEGATVQAASEPRRNRRR
jgi:serine/threonine protein kinase